jgi:hypothetical protein
MSGLCFNLHLRFVVRITDMASYPLLNANIDRGHRAALMAAGTNLDVLVPRTPKANWMIHPLWLNRYVSV